MIKFLTDGVLIREMMEDPLLTKYRYAHKIEAQIASCLCYDYSTMFDPVAEVTFFYSISIYRYWLIHNGVNSFLSWVKVH